MVDTHTLYWDGSDLYSALLDGFDYVEGFDHIVGIIYACPRMMKKIVLAMPDDVFFDYIPEGIGMLRTAYLKFRPLPTESEIRFVSQDGNLVVKILRQ